MNNGNGNPFGDGVSPMDEEALAMLSSFANSGAGREFCWRCVRSSRVGPEVREDTKGEILRALTETEACRTFFSWLVERSCHPVREVVSSSLENHVLATRPPSLLELECEEAWWMRRLLVEVREVFLVQRTAEAVSDTWYLRAVVDWSVVGKMIDEEHNNFWDPRLMDNLRSLVMEGNIHMCQSCTLPHSFLWLLCLYQDVPLDIIRRYNERHQELIGRGRVSGRNAGGGNTTVEPFIHFSWLMESRQRHPIDGSPAAFYRREHDKHPRQASSKFAEESKVFGYLRSQFKLGNEWIDDEDKDDYGQPCHYHSSKKRSLGIISQSEVNNRTFTRR